MQIIGIHHLLNDVLIDNIVLIEYIVMSTDSITNTLT